MCNAFTASGERVHVATPARDDRRAQTRRLPRAAINGDAWETRDPNKRDPCPVLLCGLQNGGIDFLERDLINEVPAEIIGRDFEQGPQL